MPNTSRMGSAPGQGAVIRCVRAELTPGGADLPLSVGNRQEDDVIVENDQGVSAVRRDLQYRSAPGSASSMIAVSQG